MTDRPHFKISANTIMLIFQNTSSKSELQLLCKKSESLTDVVDRLLKYGLINSSDSDSWVCLKNELVLDMDVSIASLCLNQFDVIQIIQRREVSDTPLIHMSILYGCPSSIDLHGNVPDCMNIYYEDFSVMYR